MLRILTCSRKFLWFHSSEQETRLRSSAIKCPSKKQQSTISQLPTLPTMTYPRFSTNMKKKLLTFNLSTVASKLTFRRPWTTSSAESSEKSSAMLSSSMTTTSSKSTSSSQKCMKNSSTKLPTLLLSWSNARVKSSLSNSSLTNSFQVRLKLTISWKRG